MINARLATRLSRETSGEVLSTAGDRARYATDASIYQVMPACVLVPKTAADVAAALAICREEGVSVLARGGGTSQCGQTVNSGLVLDFSKYLRRVLAVDEAAGTATVEPGIVLGHLNTALRKSGWFFPVDPSTHARATIGGMAGNNSCGAKSIRYGLMADNVLAIEALLADGTHFRFAPVANNLGDEVPNGIASLIVKLRALGVTEAEEIARRFPRVLRRVGGYNIDALVPGHRTDLARLLVGSEGTLAISTAVTLKLARIKARKVVGICQFPTFLAAMEAAKHLVTLDPEAVELVDRTMIDLGRAIPIYRPTIDNMLIGEPDSLLLVEFHGEDDAPLLARLAELETMMGDLGYPHAVVRATEAPFQAAIASVREAGLNIMMSMKGDGKPVSFIEDCAVPLEDLGAYTSRLTDVFTRHGLKGTWYAHASVGCLHVRPVLNMKDPTDIRRMRAVAEEAFALVREYKGSHSGEHGDGIVRSEFHTEMFGERIVRAFETVKDTFDPTAMLNPGRVVRPARMDDRTLFRYGPDYAPVPSAPPVFDWSQHPGRLLGAVEMCNSNGTCRGFDTDVLCPSYRATRDEAHVTRGRAATLRLALTGQIGRDGIASDEVAEALRLCVGCKACRRECPTGVDMARMKIEALAARASRNGLALKDKLLARLPNLAPLAGKFAPLVNTLAGSSLGVRAAGLGRRPPRFAGKMFRDGEGEASGDILLLADTFNRAFEPANLRAALKILHATGSRVAVASDGIRPLCCGRAALAVGDIPRARAEMRRLLDACAGDRPVVGIEPSCLLTLRDELPGLLPGLEANSLAGRAELLGEYLARTRPALAFRERPTTAHVHGHCHQKSFAAFTPTLAALRAIPGLTVTPIASSCCGMAGSFGYQADTQDVSRAMAEASLLPAVRAASPDDLIVADGFSCRHQISDLSGREARHSAVVLAESLA
jgi:FAD/FMN-containing dehydrogenase/Fe-S oxidoreductase